MRSLATSVADRSRFEDASSTRDDYAFGKSHHHKSLKTLFGAVGMIVVSIVLYEMGTRAVGETAIAPVASQRVAHSSHR